MARDPAFLFYPGDWQGGTSTFSRFLKGCYMDVLIAQFNNGHLSLDEIKTVLGSDFGQSWPTLQKKFTTDEKGLLFNEKLETEMVKRKEYSLSRANNRKKKDMNHICKTHDTTYEKHMGNENGNEVGIKKELSTNVPREPYSSKENFHNAAVAFEEVKQDEGMVERLLRIVQRSGFISCDRLTLMRAVRYFFTIEEAKPEFTSRHRDEVKKHLVNWITLKAKTLNQYG